MFDDLRAAVARALRSLACACALATPTVAHPTVAHAAVASPTWAHARIVERDGDATLLLDGKPFFIYGAAFFYERLPRERWAPAMRALKDLGINTLDLYVPWNWHETQDGSFDFDGRTNARRDLAEVLRLARAQGFALIVRPGPVVRNEWRNGGYPAWLLTRPEYGMPPHDVLEGRYPATATLQNAHSDDAAAQWMRNATHMRYATRWLRRALRACAPVADRVIAIALDDDQGAYVDNQTYPAPNLRRYLLALRDVVRDATSPRELTFINTYQMKVPASAPVWTMGNWYQSDAYAIGEHDRAQLEFSTALLHTRPHQPLVASEFQAGWLQGPGDIRPRPADPSNTELAMTTMLGLGVRGIVNFPAQDTLAPAGWDAPFANASYAWDAALALDGTRAARAEPTARFGALVRSFGPQLAAARTQVDAAIAYAGASYAPDALTNEAYGAIVARTILAQQACRAAGLACTLVDPHAVDARALARYRVLIVPREDGARRVPFLPDIAASLAAYRAGGGTLVDGTPTARTLTEAMRAAHRRPIVENVPGGLFARAATDDLAGFLSVPNYAGVPLVVRNASVETGRGRLALPAFVVAPHRAIVAPLDVRLARRSRRYAPDARLLFEDCMVPLETRVDGADLVFDAHARPGRCTVAIRSRAGTRVATVDARANTRVRIGTNGVLAPATARANVPAARAGAAACADDAVPIRSDACLPTGRRFAPVASGVAAYRRDVDRDGGDDVVLDNGIVRVVLSPEGGGRAFLLQDDRTRRNVFTSVGALRDDVAIEPPPSATDRIATYTHEFPAGTFNRTYAVRGLAPGDERATVTLGYDAPDVVPSGARFERTVELRRGARAIDAFVRADIRDAATLPAQRAVSVTSLSVGDGGDMRTRHVLAPDAVSFVADTRTHVDGNGLGFYDDATHELATLVWSARDVEDASLATARFSIVARLRLAPGAATGAGAHLRLGFAYAASLAEAARALRAACDDLP